MEWCTGQRRHDFRSFETIYNLRIELSMSTIPLIQYNVNFGNKVDDSNSRFSQQQWYYRNSLAVTHSIHTFLNDWSCNLEWKKKLKSQNQRLIWNIAYFASNYYLKKKIIWMFVYSCCDNGQHYGHRYIRKRKIKMPDNNRGMKSKQNTE